MINFRKLRLIDENGFCLDPIMIRQYLPESGLVLSFCPIEHRQNLKKYENKRFTPIRAKDRIESNF